MHGALGGSDPIQGFTDQGMPTDPNGHLRRPGFPYLHHGGNDFTDYEGGPGGRSAARRYREEIEKHVRSERRGGSGSIGTSHTLSINLEGFSRGTRTAYKGSGLFKEVRLNRGRVMPMASQDA